MSFQESMRNFERMPTGLKFVFFGAVFAGLFSFLPWFQIDEFTTTEAIKFVSTPSVSSGFGVFPVFGMLSMTFAIATLFVFLRHETGGKNTFGLSNPKAWMIIGGQAIFTLCIALAVFASEMRVDSTAGIRFGLFLSLIAHASIFFGGYIMEKSEKKQETREAFSPLFHGQNEHLNISPEQPQQTNNEQLSFSDTPYEREQSILRR